MVKSFEESNDGIIQKVRVNYRNTIENTDRETYWSVYELVMIHPVDELDIIHSINNIGMHTRIKMRISNSKQSLDDYDYER